MDAFTPFEKQQFPGGLSLRWLNVNCYEIKLPGGKTVVTDPFLPHETDELPLWRDNACGYTAEDLEGADYAIVGHSHGDHLGSVHEVFDRFGCAVLCHKAYAIHMTTSLMIPQQLVFPMEGEQRYEFEDFTLETCTARHLYSGPRDENGKPVRLKEIRCSSKGTPFEPLSVYGGMFNTDYILTTGSNLRIAFCSGDFPDHQRRRWADAGIQILLRQCDQYVRDNAAQAMADDILAAGAELTLPLHHERYYDTPAFTEFAAAVNQELAARNYPGRFFLPRRGTWYQLGVRIARR